MTTEYITLNPGDTFQIGDEIYIQSEERYATIDEQVAKYRFVVAPGSVCRRPVTRSVSKSDRREWEEEEKEVAESEEPEEDSLTLEEELEDELAEANDQVRRLLEENDRLKSLVDELRRGLQTSEERRLRLMHTDSVTAAILKAEVEQEEKEAGEEEAAPTLQEELVKANEYLQRVLKENMDLHNEVHTAQGRVACLKVLVDEFREKLAAADETMKADKRLHDELMSQARAERLKLTNERHLLQQEVHNLQHSLAAERRRLESLDAGGVEQEETEVEKLAREIYIHHNKNSVSVSFQYAEEFIAERDRRRKQSGK